MADDTEKTVYLIVQFAHGEMEKLGEAETEDRARKGAKAMFAVADGDMPPGGPLYVIQACKIEK